MLRAALLTLPCLLALCAPVAAQGDDAPPASPVDVHVTIAPVGFGNYDAKQGTYVLDFYLVLSWDNGSAPEGFTAERFEFANGRATSQTLQADETVDGVRSLYYRVQASLFSTPRYDAYPFDRQVIEVALEDTVHPVDELRYVPDIEGSGLEQGFEPAGWEVVGHHFEATERDLSFDEPYSQARFTVTLQRSILSGVLKVILPPLAFIAISGVAFLLRGADKVATRFSLAANMAISGIMFHAAQAASLPSLSRMIFLDRYMLAVHVFTFGSVAVTALCALAEMKWKDPERAARLNDRGMIVVPAAAVAVFLLLQLV